MNRITIADVLDGLPMEHRQSEGRAGHQVAPTAFANIGVDVDAGSDAEIPAAEQSKAKLGPKPNVAWLPKQSLQVDKRYQRQLTGSKSKSLIKKLVENFCWAHCGMLLVTDNGDGSYNVIDGQHRWKAALGIPEVSTLPCLVFDEMTLREQANAFVSLNADRVPVNPLAIFHARAVAGDPISVGIAHACTKAGVTVLRSHQSLKDLGPDKTAALGILTRIYRAYDDQEFARENITATLQVIREAYPDKAGQLTASMIGAVWLLLSEDVDRDEVIATLKRTDDAALSLDARGRVFADPALKLRDAYLEALKALMPRQGNHPGA